uniref:Polyphenol oxidase n=1 Tax=Eleocharis dulcis TaxID=110284 RepID=A0A2U8ZU88_9POAL|nr:polyphenol oxidase [Eleocharis dulcis]
MSSLFKLNSPTTSSFHSSACSFQPHKFSSHLYFPRRTDNPTIACKGTSDDNQKPNSSRREVLIGLGGLYGVSTSLGMNHSASASPIQAPDISKCEAPRDLPATAAKTNCCPPFKGQSIVDFKLPRKSEPLRVRRPAHAVDKEYIAKYTKAVELMKGLSADDPRNFTQQANVHCAYCDGAYDQVGFPDLELQIHNSWLFFPWHRFYLYFNERILGKLIGDDTFALPFWNWDAPAGMQIPAMYTNTSSSLYDKLRNPNHQPPHLINLDYNGTEPTYTRDQQIDHNLKIMYRQVISNGKTAELFMGSTYRAGDKPNPGQGALENVPHGNVHFWTGDTVNQPNGEDMGNFYSAGRDPIFFAHHANVDRMWYVWKRLGGKHQDFTDSDWLNTSFYFYDENAQLVRVQVKDCLDNEAMRFTYQDVDIPWRNSRPTPTSTGKTPATASTVTSFPVTLDKPVTTTISRPKVSRSSTDKEDEEEVLIIEGIKLEHTKFIKFDVYINATEDDDITPNASEFAGSFVHLPHKHNKGNKAPQHETVLKLAISDLLEDIKAEDDPTILVTLVPRSKATASIGSIKIGFSK